MIFKVYLPKLKVLFNKQASNSYSKDLKEISFERNANSTSALQLNDCAFSISIDQTIIRGKSALKDVFPNTP